MFSFFRKSKKEDSGNGKKNKDKENKDNNKDCNLKLQMGESSINSVSNKQENCISNGGINILNGNNKENINNFIVKESGEMEININGNAEHCSFDDKTRMYKNTQPSTPELAPESDVVPLPKNVVNAAKTISSEVATFYEKNNEQNDLKMCDSYVNGRKTPETSRASERRGSVKPCGHGTTAISPWVPIQASAKIEINSSPDRSPVMEVRKKMKYTVSTIQENGTSDIQEPQEKPQEKNEKKSENLPIAAKLSDSIGDQFENEKKNLINQEAKFQSQLNDLSKQLSVRDAEASKLRFQMEELQRDVFAKSAGMDRLQAELNAANKEADAIRQKIRHLENELENYRKRNTEIAEELKNKTDSYSNYEVETQARISELESVIKSLRVRIQTLEDQIKELKEEKEQLSEKYSELQIERNEENKKLAEAIETAAKQKLEIEKKWKQDFEKLRTVNIVKEQELLDDFEWKLREVQQTCKKKLDDKEKTIEERLQEAYREAERKMEDAEKMLGQVETLKSYELEVQQLRNQTSEQERALQEMKDQQQQMTQAEASLKNETKRLLNLIEMEKENIQHIQRIHRTELQDKERKLKDTLNQKRTEIAMYWEEKLLHECGRLKDEMEQIHDEEKYMAMESVRREKEEEFQARQQKWENKLRDCLKEIELLKKALNEKDEFYHEELIKVRSNTDRDIMKLRRLMDKIDMAHHDNYEKLQLQQEEELEKISLEHEQQLQEVEDEWRTKVGSVSANLEQVKERIEKEAQQKIESLIQQHRQELDSQWENLINQKDETIKLIEDEFVTKYKTLEEQFYTQQNSHGSREVELLKTIDALKNEVQSKDSTLDDLQSNVETLEGGVQVLNQEIAQQTENMVKAQKEADQKIRSLSQTIAKLLEEREKEREAFRQKLVGTQKQSQETIDHLQRKCSCLTKLFEEVRQRYERRESRAEDINIISDLKQVIAEQEKDLACINEEKRYFQMRLMQLERHLQPQSSVEEEDFEDAEPLRVESPLEEASSQLPPYPTQSRPSFLPSNPNDPNLMPPGQNNPIFIPPTIPECDE